MLETRIKKIEEYLDFLAQVEGKGGNMPVFEQVQGFLERVNRTDYWHFIHSADYHYFVARILFLRMVFEYSYFCGFQCIENYLKAYLKIYNHDVPTTHSLPELLKRCRQASHQTPQFIASEYIELIVRRFAPYYEFGRYPVQHSRPKGGHYMSLWPTDIFILDYFVYQIRLLMSIPENTWDLFREGKNEGHYFLADCKRNFPEFYDILKENNINFMKPIAQAEQHSENP